MTVSTKESWRTRKTNCQRTKKELREQYVKGELMNYHYYRMLWLEWEQYRIEKNIEYEEHEENPVKGNSFMQLPEGIGTKSPWQLDKTAEVYDVLNVLYALDHNMQILDQWLSCLTSEQKDAVLAYVIDRQCSDLAGASSSLVGRTEKGIYNSQDRAIEKISKKIS